MKHVKIKLGLWMIAAAVCLPKVEAQSAGDGIKRESTEWLDIWAPNTNDKGLPRVLLIGNSITRQYHKDVEKQLEGKAYVVRLSTSKSLGDPALLDEVSLVMKQYDFDVVHFNNGLHGWSYTEDEYAAALPALYKTIRRNAPDAKLIWASSTPMRTGDGMAEYDGRNGRIKERNRIAAEFFKDKPVVINDLYSVVEKSPMYYAKGDGIHPNPTGVRALANRVTDEISSALDYETDLVNFPQGYTPQEIGKKLGYHFVPGGRYLKDRKTIVYPEVCTWLGALRYAQEVGDDNLITLLQKRFDKLAEEKDEYFPAKNHVDYNMFGCLPLELYQLTNDKKYYNIGMSYADTQWTLPTDATDEQKAWMKKGYTWQTRLWIDDMFMITIVQAQAYRVTGNAKYINRAAREMVMYLDELQRPNGLFYHAPDVPFLWARGNGWMAAGMVELLRVLPANNPDRKRILEGYRLMMKNLKDYQYNDGMWNQLIDEPDFWPETSGSAMFAYAMILGVKNGWLDAKEYTPVARRAWLSLVNYINEKGDIAEVCVGTNKKNDKQYYYDRPRITGDYHGQAPILWCVYALLAK